MPSYDAMPSSVLDGLIIKSRYEWRCIQCDTKRVVGICHGLRSQYIVLVNDAQLCP